MNAFPLVVAADLLPELIDALGNLFFGKQICRQLLWEYCGNIVVHLVSLRGKTETYLLEELLPHAFDRGQL